MYKKKNFLQIIFTTLALIVLSIFFASCFVEPGKTQSTATNKSNPTLFERKATVNDIILSDDYNFPSNIEFKITPKYDIKDLQLTIKFYDEDGKLIKTQIKIVGNVSEGVQVSVTIPLSDFSLSELWNLHSYKCAVSSGTISYFQ